MIRHCKNCQAAFRVDALEQEWTRGQGLSLPRRCAHCRAERRGIVDEERSCTRCKTTFVLPAELALLAMTMGWKLPPDCLTGCAGGKGPKSFRGERRKLAEFWLRMCEAIEEPGPGKGDGPKSADLSNLFSGLDAMLEQAAQEEAKSLNEAEEQTKDGEGATGGESPAEPRSFAGDDVPSPDDLFKGLAGPRRKTSS